MLFEKVLQLLQLVALISLILLHQLLLFLLRNRFSFPQLVDPIDSIRNEFDVGPEQTECHLIWLHKLVMHLHFLFDTGAT